VRERRGGRAEQHPNRLALVATLHIDVRATELIHGRDIKKNANGWAALVDVVVASRRIDSPSWRSTSGAQQIRHRYVDDRRGSWARRRTLEEQTECDLRYNKQVSNMIWLAYHRK
jgi:hypothetical protein